MICLAGFSAEALAQSEPEPRAMVVVDDAEIPQGQEAIIRVTLTEDPAGLVSFQGTLSFDPSVISVLEVIFPEECPVWAANIENGLVRFAATKCSGEEEDIKTGELFRLRVLAVGSPGSTTTLTPVFTIFHDFEFNLIPHEVDPGVIVITGGGVGAPPVADFDYSPRNPRVNETVKFIDLSRDPDGRIVRWEWDFSDGGTSDVQSPSHQFAQPGTYRVSLTVTDNSGTVDTATKQIVVGTVGFVCFNYPNPARVSTTILCGVPDGTTQATLRIFNLKGALVKTQELSLSQNSYVWNLKDDRGNDLPNGPYFYLLRAVTPDGVRTTRVEVLIIER